MQGILQGSILTVQRQCPNTVAAITCSGSRRCRENVSPQVRVNLQREVAQLEKLKHKHFGRCGGRITQFSLPLQLPATTDLETKLNQCSRNGFNYERESRDCSRGQVMSCQIMLIAFGCLSSRFPHMHGLDLINGGIRPANILYQEASSTLCTARFLWAYPGVHTHPKSGIERSSQYLGDYAAPENDVSKDSAAPHKERAEHLEGSQFMNLGDGKSMKTFSLDCVVLRVLSVLIGDKSEKKNRSFAPYCKNVDRVHGSIEGQTEGLTEDQVSLAVTLRLGMRMTQANPKQRPLIDDVVNELTTAGRQFCCNECLSPPNDFTNTSSKLNGQT